MASLVRMTARRALRKGTRGMAALRDSASNDLPDKGSAHWQKMGIWCLGLTVASVPTYFGLQNLSTRKEPRSLEDDVAKEWVRYNKSYEKFQKMNPIEHFKQTGKLYDYKPSYSK